MEGEGGNGSGKKIISNIFLSTTEGNKVSPQYFHLHQAKMFLYVIFAIFPNKLHTLNMVWGNFSLGWQKCGNTLASVRTMTWIICPPGIGIKAVIQYMQTTDC